MFFCKFCEISKSTFFTGQPPCDGFCYGFKSSVKKKTYQKIYLQSKRHFQAKIITTINPAKLIAHFYLILCFPKPKISHLVSCWPVNGKKLFFFCFQHVALRYSLDFLVNFLSYHSCLYYSSVIITKSTLILIKSK